ncbi:hypothetical protein VPH35_118980 [Triticum aestivum]
MQYHPHKEVLLKMPSPNNTWEEKLQDPSAIPVSLPLEFLKGITSNFSTERELGSGGYGVVYKGILPSGKFIAVKKLHNSLHNLGDENFLKEASSLMKVNHRNVVQFLGYCAESRFEAMDPQGSGKLTLAEIPKRLLCFEHICNKSLSEYISDESLGLEWNMRYDIIRGICGGLRYLHEECHIVHLDMKPDNILMDANMTPKIADFGLSRIFGDKQSQTITQNRLGTPGYMAPEYILRGAVSIKADIYSLGVIIIQILSGCTNYPYPPSEDNSPESTQASFQHFKENILEKWRNRLHKLQGDTVMLEQIRVCADLGVQCIASNPDNRPVTKHMIDRLDDVNIMDGSIKTGVLSTSSVAQINCIRGEGRGGHHAKLMDFYQKIRAAETKPEIKVPLHGIQDEGEPSTAWVASPGSSETSCSGEHAIDQEIARSRLGVLYKGKLSNGSAVVVKRLAIAIAIGDKLFLHAAISLKSVKHNSIVRFLGYCSISQPKEAREGAKTVIIIVRERLLCFEYLCNGNLQMHLTDESCGFDWHTRYQTIKGICQGLHCLHDGGIAHLDLKPENILFDEKMVPKILDYGLSRVFSEEIRQTVLNNIDGSLAYMATPEYKTGGEITLKSDIYCLGVIIMQIVTGQSKKNYPNIASIVESWRSRLELNASKGRHTFETCYQQVQVCIEIGIRCMDDDPGKRPVTRYIVNKLDNKETKQSIRCGMLVPSKATLLPSCEELKSPVAPRALLPAPWAVQSSLRQVMVLKLEINGKRCISSFILRIASKLEGIKSMTVDEEKSTLMVVGTVDVVKLVTVLRKAKHLAHVITVGSAENVVYQSDSIDVHDQESDSCTIM